jgi:alkanesulfonate monooxygenase SsuD/methylene tetrahydromethanopterin reductase-like flavin-dependent oxidoreductase (luciferase family)
MKIAIGFPSPIPPEVVVRAAQYLESRGIEGCFGHEPLELVVRDVFVNLTLIATNTERITLGPNVVNPYTRHPVQVARAIAHLDELSKGRAFLHWGVGHRNAIKASFGIPHDRFLTHMREAVELSKLVLSGHMPPDMEPPIADEYKLDYDGEIFHFRDNVELRRGVKIERDAVDPPLPVDIDECGQILGPAPAGELHFDGDGVGLFDGAFQSQRRTRHRFMVVEILRRER